MSVFPWRVKSNARPLATWCTEAGIERSYWTLDDGDDLSKQFVLRMVGLGDAPARRARQYMDAQRNTAGKWTERSINGKRVFANFDTSIRERRKAFAARKAAGLLRDEVVGKEFTVRRSDLVVMCGREAFARVTADAVNLVLSWSEFAGTIFGRRS